MIDGVVIPTSFGVVPFWDEQKPQETQYEFIRRHIRGMIEPIRFQVGQLEHVWMYVHDEGKLLGLPVNRYANRLTARFAWHILASGDYIVGTAIIVGPIDEEGNHRRFTAEQRNTISEVIRLRETTNNQGETP
jgi:hypothetical protein